MAPPPRHRICWNYLIHRQFEPNSGRNVLQSQVREGEVSCLEVSVGADGHLDLVSGLGFKIYDSGNRVSGFGFRDSGFGIRVSSNGFRVTGFGFRVVSFGFRISGFGFRVSGFGFLASGFRRL